MKCKECVHYEVCNTMFYGTLDKDTNNCADECNLYKNKSTFIHFPCKVGDTVYFIKSRFGYIKEPIQGNIVDISSCSKDMDFIFICVKNYSTITSFHIDMTFKLSDIGKNVFFSRREAEKMLKRSK